MRSARTRKLRSKSSQRIAVAARDASDTPQQPPRPADPLLARRADDPGSCDRPGRPCFAPARIRRRRCRAPRFHDRISATWPSAISVDDLIGTGAPGSDVGSTSPRSMRILLLTHYFPPEVGAPQTRLRETVALLQALGHEVRVVTGPPHYPDGRVRPGYRASHIRRERRDGPPSSGSRSIPRPNRTFVDRAIDQGSFAAATLAAVSDIRWADVLIVESPPLFLGLSAAFHRAVTGRPYLFHVADPWPDFPIAIGALENRQAQRLALAIERISYQSASLITTVTPGLVARLERKRGATGRVRLLPNGVNLDRFRPDISSDSARRRLGWPEVRLTLAYVGSVGLAQGVQTLVDAVAPLREEGVELRMIGDGFDRDRLAQATADAGLAHIHFDPAVPAASVPDLLGRSRRDRRDAAAGTALRGLAADEARGGTRGGPAGTRQR